MNSYPALRERWPSSPAASGVFAQSFSHSSSGASPTVPPQPFQPGDGNGPAAPGAADSGPSPVDVISERLGSLKLQKSSFGSDLKSAVAPWNSQRWLTAAVLAVLFLFGFFAWRSGWFSRATTAGPVSNLPSTEVLAVTAVPNDTGDEAMASLSGYVVAESKIQVPAKVTGTVAELPIQEGSKISKGDLLVRLDGESFEYDLMQAVGSEEIAKAQLDELEQGSRIEDIEQLRANVEKAESRLGFCKKALARSKKLSGDVVAAQIDEEETNVREAEAFLKQVTFALQMSEKGSRPEQIAAAAGEVKRAKAVREKAQYLFDCTRIVSEIDGTVLQKLVELGESIRVDPVTGSPTLCVIANLDNLLAEIDVKEADLQHVTIGQDCLVWPESAPGLIYKARVERRAPVVNRTRGVVQVKVRILDPDDKLMPDMSCKVRFLSGSGSADQSVQVPELALVKQGKSPVVFVLEGDVARERTVTIGKTHDQWVEITSGVRAGEKVLLSRQPLVDGQSVQARVK